jgi:hypothetical protein
MAPLAPKTLGLRKGQSVDAEGFERLFHVVKFERLHYRYDEFHLEFLLGFVVVVSAGFRAGWWTVVRSL